MADRQSFSEILGSIQQATGYFDEAIRRVPFGIYVDRPEVGCVYANDTLLSQFGVTWEDFSGFGWARSIEPADVPGLETAIAEYEHSLEPIFVHYRVNRPDGTQAWINARVYAIQDAQGRHVGSIGTTEDTTEQRIQRQEWSHLQRMEAVGRLSARTAHDFNNTLGVILMGVEMVAEEPLSKAGRRQLDMVLRAVDQAARITEQLLILSGRRQSSGESVTEINSTLHLLESLITHTAGEGVDVTLNLSKKDANVPVDIGQLGQIILNLITNARDAMEATGKILVECRVDEKRARLSVQDWGHGMTDDQLRRAADPFFTTKELGKGTGLGLSTVSDIVTVVGGGLQLESTMGKGTIVAIELPIVEAARPAARRDDGEMLNVDGNGIRLLLVEDNDALRQSVGYALAMRGYNISATGRFETACNRLAEESIDMVVSDILLLDGNGTDLFKAAPQLPFVFITGFAGEQEKSLNDLGPNVSWLSKPFKIADLLEALARLRSTSK